MNENKRCVGAEKEKRIPFIQLQTSNVVNFFSLSQTLTFFYEENSRKKFLSPVDFVLGTNF